jgi:hypothetical protein
MLAGHWDGRLIQVLGSSQYVGQRWRFPIDLLFIDGDHRYEYVKQDIELFVPHVMEGGYILFHDYAEKLKKPKAGVKKAVDELLGHYEVVGQRKWLWAIMKPFTLHGTTE